MEVQGRMDLEIDENMFNNVINTIFRNRSKESGKWKGLSLKFQKIKDRNWAVSICMTSSYISIDLTLLTKTHHIIVKIRKQIQSTISMDIIQNLLETNENFPSHYFYHMKNKNTWIKQDRENKIWAACPSVVAILNLPFRLSFFISWAF